MGYLLNIQDQRKYINNDVKIYSMNKNLIYSYYSY